METIRGDLSKLEAELAVVKEQRDIIDFRLKDEKSRVAVLEQQNRSLEEELEESKSCRVCSMHSSIIGCCTFLSGAFC